MSKTASLGRGIVYIGLCMVAVALCTIFYFSLKIPHSRAAATAELPRVTIDTTYPTFPPSHAVRSVKSSCLGVSNCYTSLQTAINNSILGDEIVIDAGLTVTGPIVLKHKTSGSGTIVIRTSNMAGLPAAGTRVSPSNASAMAKIVSPGSGVPALQTEDNSDNYRLVGIEFAKVDPSVTVYDLVLLGNNTTQVSLSQVPKNITLDRVYAHGDPTSDLKRCIKLDSAYTAIVDSYIAECHVVGQDAQAIGGINGPGPFKIVNNYIQASTENVLFGGDVPKITNLIPSDIEIRNNYITKDLAWKNGPIHWAEKNILELKNAERVLIDGNILENAWLDGQLGYVFVLTPRNAGGARDKGATWAAVQDITITNNVGCHASGALNLLGYDYFSNDGQDFAGSDQARNIVIYNNLFYDISKTWNPGAVPVLLATDRPANIRIDHNTFINDSGNDFSFGDKRSDGTYDTIVNFTFTNNLMFHRSYGFFGTGVGEGTVGINTYFPGVVFNKNILASDTSIAGKYPSSNTCNATCYPTVASLDSEFSDLSLGMSDVISGFALKSTSPYKNAGTDGKNIGASIPTVSTAVANVITGGGSGSPSPVVGDLNLDHIVNSLDYSILNSHWFTNDATSDLNHDGFVNAIDYSILNSNWFKTW